MEVGFGYGVFCDTLEKQANEQGFTLGEKADKYETFKHELLDLFFGDLITDCQLDGALKKLNKRVVKSLKKQEEQA